MRGPFTGCVSMADDWWFAQSRCYCNILMHLHSAFALQALKQQPAGLASMQNALACQGCQHSNRVHTWPHLHCSCHGMRMQLQRHANDTHLSCSWRPTSHRQPLHACMQCMWEMQPVLHADAITQITPEGLSQRPKAHEASQSCWYIQDERKQPCQHNHES